MRGLILGAGFTGLAAGITTGLPIFEASEQAGGICNSYIKDGFEFQVGGGHWIFGKGPGLDYIKTLVPVNEYERRASVYYNHSFPYPIQTTAQKEIAAYSGSLKQWLVNKFGLEQCNLFFHPFNEKYTAGLYDDIIQYDDFKSPPAGSLGFVSTFGDPEGGLSAVVAKMQEKCTVHFKKRAIRIDIVDKFVNFDDGTIEEYDKLVSTIPLDQLLRLCGKTDFHLPFTSVFVLNIGAVPASNTPSDHWIYVPFCKSNFYRLGFYSNVDARKAPKGKVGLSVEMAFHGVERVDLDEAKIINDVVDELQNWRFIGETITVDPTWVRCGYTWMKSKEHRDEQLQWLKAHDIISTGRYGKWHFQGMVDSMKDGFEVKL